MSKRRSVFEQSAALTAEIREVEADLVDIWNRIGMDESQREERVQTVYAHLSNLIQSMLKEERAMEHVLEADIRDWAGKAKTLLRSLARPTHDVNVIIADEPKIRAIRSLRAFVADLEAETDAIRADYSALVAKEDSLAQLLGLDATLSQAQPPDFLPSNSQVVELRARVAEMKREAESRAEKLAEFRERAAAVAATLGDETEMEGPVAELLASAEDGSAFPLSDSNLASLPRLLTELETRAEAKKAAVAERIRAVKTELESVYADCMVPEDSRAILPELSPAGFSEAAINRYHDEIFKWMEWHSERAAVLDRLRAWKGAWERLCELKSRPSDPLRYRNRGMELELELKEQRRLESVELPRAEAALKVALSDWQRGRSERLQLQDGLTPLEYIHRAKKEAAEAAAERRARKDTQRRREIVHDSIWGASPSSRSPAPRARSPRALSASRLQNRPPSRLLASKTTGLAASTPRLQLTPSASPLKPANRFPQSARPLTRLKDSAAASYASTSRLHELRLPHAHTPGLAPVRHLHDTIDEEAFMNGSFDHSSLRNGHKPPMRKPIFRP